MCLIRKKIMALQPCFQCIIFIIQLVFVLWVLAMSSKTKKVKYLYKNINNI